jgi:hypothetical protein
LGEKFMHNPGASRRGIAKPYLRSESEIVLGIALGFIVIARSDLSAVAQRAKAEATKQSILPLRGAMDCFAEPVIGRAYARPVGSQ